MDKVILLLFYEWLLTYEQDPCFQQAGFQNDMGVNLAEARISRRVPDFKFNPLLVPVDQIQLSQFLANSVDAR